jgi:hypothetical protein
MTSNTGGSVPVGHVGPYIMVRFTVYTVHFSLFPPPPVFSNYKSTWSLKSNKIFYQCNFLLFRCIWWEWAIYRLMFTPGRWVFHSDFRTSRAEFINNYILEYIHIYNTFFGPITVQTMFGNRGANLGAKWKAMFLHWNVEMSTNIRGFLLST